MPSAECWVLVLAGSGVGVDGDGDLLDDFEADLSDEQKAGFEAIGPKRGA